MSHETLDPDQYHQPKRKTMTKKKTINLESAPAAATVAPADNVEGFSIESIVKNPEIMATVMNEGAELVSAIKDIPAQLELLSRVTLASKFIVTKPDGTKEFKTEQFENLWAYLTAPQETGEAE